MVDPALGRMAEDGDFIHQALGAFALARAARLTGDEKYAVRAGPDDPLAAGRGTEGPGQSGGA